MDILEQIKNNQLNYSIELEIFDLLVKKFNPISMADYAKLHNISQPAAIKRIDNGKEMFLEIANRKFVIL